MRQLFILSMITLLALATGCEQLTATVQAASFLTRTPDLANADGMDPDLVAALPLDDLSVKEGVGVFVGLAEKESATSTAAPIPIAGAGVEIAWETSQVLVCPIDEPDADGTYAATNLPTETCGDPALAYVESTKYITRIETGTDLYTIEVIAPAGIDAANVSFSPNLAPAADFFGASLKRHSANTKLTVDWSADPASNERNSFLTVVRLNFNGGGNALDAGAWTVDANNPVFDNFPREPKEMMDLVLKQPVTSVVIPAADFDTNGIYLIVLTPTELSTVVSSNLALGSGGLAGTGTAWIFLVD
ncbi:MAG: hypothetical protein V3T05_04955 [Myxococcota bacterium]